MTYNVSSVTLSLTIASTLFVMIDGDIQLVNLRPSTRYVLHIGAKNQVGVGQYTEYSVTTDSVRKCWNLFCGRNVTHCIGSW